MSLGQCRATYIPSVPADASAMQHEGENIDGGGARLQRRRKEGVGLPPPVLIAIPRCGQEPELVAWGGAVPDARQRGPFSGFDEDVLQQLAWALATDDSDEQAKDKVAAGQLPTYRTYAISFGRTSEAMPVHHAIWVFFQSQTLQRYD